MAHRGVHVFVIPEFVLKLCLELWETVSPLMWPSAAAASGFFNILAVFAPSGFISDPDTEKLSLEDIAKERTIPSPSGFVADPSKTRPSLWDL